MREKEKDLEEYAITSSLDWFSQNIQNTLEKQTIKNHGQQAKLSTEPPLPADIST